jgi:hypothetical protein
MERWRGRVDLGGGVESESRLGWRVRVDLSGGMDCESMPGWREADS